MLPVSEAECRVDSAQTDATMPVTSQSLLAGLAIQRGLANEKVLIRYRLQYRRHGRAVNTTCQHNGHRCVLLDVWLCEARVECQGQSIHGANIWHEEFVRRPSDTCTANLDEQNTLRSAGWTMPLRRTREGL